MSITRKQIFHFAQNQLGVYIQKVGKRIFTDSYSYTVTVDAAQATFTLLKDDLTTEVAAKQTKSAYADLK